MRRKPGANGRGKRPAKTTRPAKASRRKSAPISIRKPSPKLLRRALARQKEAGRIERQKGRAQAAIRHFRPRKADRGKFVLLTTRGNRGAAAKGRKGYLAYVSKAGKKSLMRVTKDYKPRKSTDIQAPLWRAPRAAKEFETAKLEHTGAGRSVVKGRGSVKVSGAFDFSDKVVGHIARSLKTTIERQASHRSYLINANVLAELPDGSTQVFSFAVPIAKADNIQIELEGLENFVRQKFYKFLATELSMAGYVTSGSANHVRRLSVNKGKPRDQWQAVYRDAKGRSYLGEWKQMYKPEVSIRLIEWQIEQAK